MIIESFAIKHPMNNETQRVVAMLGNVNLRGQERHKVRMPSTEPAMINAAKVPVRMINDP
jgi:hypothetical protein